MSLELRQVPIHCSNCGQWLYEVTRTIVDINNSTEEKRLENPVCRCHGARFLDCLRNAIVIKTITTDPRLAGRGGS